MIVLRLVMTGEVVGSRDKVVGESCAIGKGREQSSEYVETWWIGTWSRLFEHVQNSRGPATINFSRTRVLLPSYCSREGSHD